MNVSRIFLKTLLVTTLIFFAFKKINSMNDFVEPINSLLADINEPIIITMPVCWCLETKYDFLKKFILSNNTKNRRYQVKITDLDMNEIPSHFEECQQLIILDANCDSSAELLDKLFSGQVYSYKWLIIQKNEMKSEANIDNFIRKYFYNLPVLSNVDFFVMAKTLSKMYFIKQVYRVTTKTPLIIESFGMYSVNKEKFYDYRKIRSIVARRNNLLGISLRASLVITNNETLNHLDDYKDKHIDTISKVNYRLTNYIMDYINATLIYNYVDSWGYRNETTKKWSGMTGDLIDGKAELGASPLFVKKERINVIDYIAMTSYTNSKFVFISPKLSSTENVFVLPFDIFVWYSLATLALLSIMFLLFAVWVEWKVVVHESAKQNPTILRPSIIDIVLLVVGATCQQGSSISPRSSAARVIMIFTFIVFMFIYTSYSASIVAILQSPSFSITTLEDLLKSRLELGVDDTVYNDYYFKNEKDFIKRSIYQKKILQNDGSRNFMPLVEGVEKIRKGFFAFHMELGVGYKLISETYLEHEKCRLQEISYLDSMPPYYAIQKNSSIKDILKIGLFRIREYGIQDRENSKLYTKKPKCNGIGTNFIRVGLTDIYPALLLLCWGFLFALIMLSIEIFIEKNRCTN